MNHLITALTVLVLATPASAGALPEAAATPGVLNPIVPQADIGSTICQRGWPAELKRQQLYDPASPCYAPGMRPGEFEEDHQVPLSSAARRPTQRNPWPEP